MRNAIKTCQQTNKLVMKTRQFLNLDKLLMNFNSPTLWKIELNGIVVIKFEKAWIQSFRGILVKSLFFTLFPSALSLPKSSQDLNHWFNKCLRILNDFANVFLLNKYGVVCVCVCGGVGSYSKIKNIVLGGC